MAATLEELLVKKRLECDPLADDAVSAVVRHRGKHVLSSTKLYETVKELGTRLKEPSCASFLELYEREPPWHVQWEKCEKGRRFFVRNSAFAGLVLMYGSLILSFTAASGNKVLLAMGRLTAYGDVRRRLFETLYFVKVVVLGSANEIKAECMRVRLLHAAIRYHLWHRDIGWEDEKYGHPINQEDLAGTLSTFSCVVICGLGFLGVLATKDEKDGYQHLWKYVGHYLGLSSDLQSNNFEEEWILGRFIIARQCKPDRDSVVLTESLLQAFASKPPFNFSYDTTSKLSRHLTTSIDKDLANKLCFRKFGVIGLIGMTFCYWLLTLLTFLQRVIFPLERGMYIFGRYCLQALVELSLNRKKPSYMMKVQSATVKNGHDISK